MIDQPINALLGLPAWIPAISTSAVLGIVGVLLGTVYKAQIEKSIATKFDARLEELKSKLRIDEERFRADLKERDQEISALRSGALSGAAARYAILDKRRIEAVEKLWVSVVHLGQFKAAAYLTKALKMDAVMKAAARGDQEADKLKVFGGMLWSTAGLDKATPDASAEVERLFIPPATWALFTAYRQIVGYPAAQLAVIRSGTDADVLADPGPILDLMKVVLPHQSKFVEELGAGSIGYLIDELEESLLRNLSASLEQGGLDTAGIGWAANIIKVTRDITSAQEGNSVSVPEDLREFANESRSAPKLG